MNDIPFKHAKFNSLWIYVLKHGSKKERIFAYILFRANEEGEFSHSQGYISKTLGISRQYVNKTISELEETGYIRTYAENTYHGVLKLISITRTYEISDINALIVNKSLQGSKQKTTFNRDVNNSRQDSKELLTEVSGKDDTNNTSVNTSLDISYDTSLTKTEKEIKDFKKKSKKRVVDNG